MQITLTNGYYIEIDELNHTLKQEYVGKDKNGNSKVSVRVIGYYGNLKNAVEGFIKHNQIDSMAYTSLNMREYVKIVDQINKDTVRAIMSVLAKENEHDGE